MLEAPHISRNHRAGAVQKVVGESPGVSGVEANDSTKQVQAHCDTDRGILSAIETARAGAGYLVGKATFVPEKDRHPAPSGRFASGEGTSFVQQPQ